MFKRDQMMPSKCLSTRLYVTVQNTCTKLKVQCTIVGGEKLATRTFKAGVKRKIKHTKYFSSNIEGNYYNLTNPLRYLCVYICAMDGVFGVYLM